MRSWLSSCGLLLCCGMAACGGSARDSTTIAVTPTVPPPPVTLALISLQPSGAQFTDPLALQVVPNGITPDGRYIQFTVASHQVNLDSSTVDYLRDTCAGAASCATSTSALASAGFSFDLGTAGGTEVTGLSAAANLMAVTEFALLAPGIPGFSASAEVRTSCVGDVSCTPTISFIVNDHRSHAISANGRFLLASSLFVNTSLPSPLQLYDSCVGASGCTSQLLWTGPQTKSRPSLAGEDQYVVFDSDDSTIVAGDTNGVTDVFLSFTCVGAPAGCVQQNVGISVSTDGSQANGASSSPAVSASGRYVTFTSTASNLAANDTNGASDVFLRDTCVGAPAECQLSTARVSVATDGTEANGSSSSGILSVSDDGRFVVFESSAPNLVANDTNGVSDVFLRDTCIGASSCTPSTVRLSVSDAGAQGNN